VRFFFFPPLLYADSMTGKSKVYYDLLLFRILLTLFGSLVRFSSHPPDGNVFVYFPLSPPGRDGFEGVILALEMCAFSLPS